MIHRIAIKNFRSLNVDFELDPVTVLIGRSGTGKTNFVEAMRFLRNVIQYGTVNPQGNIANIFPLMDDPKNPCLEYHLEFDAPMQSDLFKYDIKIANNRIHDAGFSGYGGPEMRNGYGSFGDTRIIEESFYVNDKRIFYISQGKVKETPVPSQQDVTHSGCYLSHLSGFQKISIARIALTQGLACYDFPGSVCTGKDVTDNLKNGNLNDKATNYHYVFNAISKDLSRLKSWDMINRALKSLNSTFVTVDVSAADMTKIFVSHLLGSFVYSFDIAMESEGFRRFFAHLLAIYQTPSKQTLVFEEPERGIHPGALQSLAEILKYAPEEGLGQVILTTHSPQLLDHFDADSIRAVEIHNGKTQIGRIAQDQLESIKEYLLSPGELLTVTDAQIEEVVSNAT